MQKLVITTLSQFLQTLSLDDIDIYVKDKNIYVFCESALVRQIAQSFEVLSRISRWLCQETKILFHTIHVLEKSIYTPEILDQIEDLDIVL